MNSKCPKQKPKVSYIRYLAWFLLLKERKGWNGREGYKKVVVAYDDNDKKK